MFWEVLQIYAQHSEPTYMANEILGGKPKVVMTHLVFPVCSVFEIVKFARWSFGLKDNGRYL